MTSEVTVLENTDDVAIVTVVCDRPDGVVLQRSRTAGKNLDNYKA